MQINNCVPALKKWNPHTLKLISWTPITATCVVYWVVVPHASCGMEKNPPARPSSGARNHSPHVRCVAKPPTRPGQRPRCPHYLARQPSRAPSDPQSALPPLSRTSRSPTSSAFLLWLPWQPEQIPSAFPTANHPPPTPLPPQPCPPKTTS